MHWEPTTIRKEPSADHRYGKDVSRRGGYVYAAYSDDKVIAIGATVKEARMKYREAYDAERGIARNPGGLPPPNPRVRRWNEGRNGEVLPGRRRKGETA
jgi:hypothetical protein